MIKEAIDKILQLSPPNVSTRDGIDYSDRRLYPIVQPIPDEIAVHTLKGLTELLSAELEGLDPKGDAKDKVFIHVISPTQVSLTSRVSDKHGRRLKYIVADCAADLPKFPFGQFMQPEAFIILLQSVFVPDAGDVDYLLRTTSSLTTENISTAEDDGISQRTALRKGIALKESALIKARVNLAPFRTFREVEQPASEFLFRLRPAENAPPQCALFEADGGRWRLAAMDSVAAWLSRNSEVTVIS